MDSKTGKALVVAHNWLGSPSPGLRAGEHLLIGQQLVGHALLHIQIHDCHTLEPGSQPGPTRMFSYLHNITMDVNGLSLHDERLDVISSSKQGQASHHE